MNRFFRVIKFLLYLLIAELTAFFIKFFCPGKRNIWIISERGDDARDNGYFFYKYMVKKHPEQKLFFVISKKSDDYGKIQKLGNPVEFDSFRHYLYYALSKVRISSNAWGGDLPKTDYFNKLPFLLSKKRKFVCLQHGITKDYMPELICSNIKIDLLIAGAFPEYEYMRDNFGHPQDVVQYTGFSRFDNLHNIKCKKQILVMPTFRKWIKSEEAGADYFNVWNDVINSKKLSLFLKENDYELVFYPHYMLQKYLYRFVSDSERIHIAGFADYDVQELLIESELLVTDFSSVFFDFAYMEKPVIYYQFDRAKYIKDHYDYTKGYFDYDSMGFGPVVFDKDDLIDQIIKHIQSGCILNKEYKAQVDYFFKLKDDKNNERIFNAIINMLGK